MTATLCSLPDCDPSWWDEDAPDMDRLLAVCRCCICPSMAACAAAGAADPLATGVWGARFFRSQPTAARKAKRGHPLGWDRLDEAKVVRALAGERLPLSKTERVESVRQLHTWGLDDLQIAQRLGCDPRQVLRDRQLLDLPAQRPSGVVRTWTAPARSMRANALGTWENGGGPKAVDAAPGPDLPPKRPEGGW